MASSSFTDPAKIEEYIDWRNAKTNVIGDIKNQGKCPCCWAIVAVTLIEQQYRGYAYCRQKERDTIKLASQQLVDCYRKDKTICYPATIKKALKWIQDNGICSEDAYGTYLDKKERCKELAPTYTDIIADIITICPSENLSGSNKFLEIEMRVAQKLKSHPIGAGVPVYKSLDKWNSSGIYGGPEEGEDVEVEIVRGLDGKMEKMIKWHAIILVGREKQDNINYWLVQNSKGVNWGENGIGKIICSSSLPGGYNDEIPLVDRFIYPQLKLKNMK